MLGGTGRRKQRNAGPKSIFKHVLEEFGQNLVGTEMRHIGLRNDDGTLEDIHRSR